MKLSPDQLGQWYRIARRYIFRSGGGGADDAKPVALVPVDPRQVPGLKAAINDMLAMSGGDFAMDREHQAAGLPTFDEMAELLREKDRAILRRGVIRDEEEYYIVREILTDADSGRRPATLKKLGALLHAYEQAQSKPKPAAEK